MAMSPIPQACKPLRPKLSWNGKKIPVEVCENLIYGMPQRIAQVLERKGSWTDYYIRETKKRL